MSADDSPTQLRNLTKGQGQTTRDRASRAHWLSLCSSVQHVEIVEAEAKGFFPSNLLFMSRDFQPQEIAQNAKKEDVARFLILCVTCVLSRPIISLVRGFASLEF